MQFANGMHISFSLCLSVPHISPRVCGFARVEVCVSHHKEKRKNDAVQRERTTRLRLRRSSLITKRPRARNARSFRGQFIANSSGLPGQRDVQRIQDIQRGIYIYIVYTYIFLVAHAQQQQQPRKRKTGPNDRHDQDDDDNDELYEKFNEFALHSNTTDTQKKTQQKTSRQHAQNMHVSNRRALLCCPTTTTAKQSINNTCTTRTPGTRQIGHAFGGGGGPFAPIQRVPQKHIICTYAWTT